MKHLVLALTAFKHVITRRQKRWELIIFQSYCSWGAVLVESYCNCLCSKINYVTVSFSFFGRGYGHTVAFQSRNISHVCQFACLRELFNEPVCFLSSLPQRPSMLGFECVVLEIDIVSIPKGWLHPFSTYLYIIGLIIWHLCLPCLFLRGGGTGGFRFLES